MAYAPLKLMGSPLPPVSGETGLVNYRPAMIATKTTIALPLQVREKKQNLQAPKSLPISRRDAIVYTTAEILSGLTLLSAEPAEARIGKLENKRKVMEKLEKLRDKAGVSKPNTKDKIIPPPPRPGNPQQGSVDPLVEAILP